MICDFPVHSTNSSRRSQANDQIALCYGQALIGDARRQLPTGEIYPLRCLQGDIFWELLEDNFIPMPSVLVRKSSLAQRRWIQHWR